MKQITTTAINQQIKHNKQKKANKEGGLTQWSKQQLTQVVQT